MIAYKSLENVVRGVVRDSLTRSLLPGANIAVITEYGSYHGAADKEGRFEVRVKRGYQGSEQLKLEVSHIGYRIFRAYYTDQQTRLDVGSIYLSPDVAQVDSVTVTARARLFHQRGDTLVYFLPAVRYRQGASLLDALKKMPGVEVDDRGNVKVEGQEVERTYVNGKLVYGKGDPKNALLYIEAKDVASVLAYEETDEVSALKQGKANARKRKVLNVQTFDLFSSSLIVAAGGSYGADMAPGSDGSRQERYQMQAGARFFSEQTQLMAEYAGNNLQSDGSFLDQDRFSYLPETPAEEYRRSNRITAKYSGKVKRSDLSAQYEYSDRFGRNSSVTHRDYFAAGDQPPRFYADSLSSRSTTRQHKGSFDLSRLTDKSYTQGFLRYEYTRGTGDALTSASARQGESLSTFVRSENGSLNRGHDVDLTLVQVSPTKIGSFTLSATGTLKKDDPDGWRRDSSSVAGDPTRYLTIGGTDRDNSVSLAGSYAIGRDLLSLNTPPKNWGSLILGYELKYTDRQTRSMTLDLDTRDIDTTLSRNFTYRDLSQTASLAYDIRVKSFSIYLYLAYRNTDLRREDRFPFDGEIRKPYDAFLPSVRLHFSPRENNRFRTSGSFSYTTDAGTPALEMLSPKLDYANPLMLSAGNPDLRQSYTHSFGLHYFRMNLKSQSTFSADLGASIHRNRIAGNQRYFSGDEPLPQYNYTPLPGAVLSTYGNLSGGYDYSAALTYRRPVNFIKSLVSFSVNYRFDHSPMFLNSVPVTLDSHAPEASLTYESNFSDVLSLNLSHNLRYRHSESGLGQTDRALVNVSKADVSLDFLKRMFVRTSYVYYRDFSNSQQRLRFSNHLLNASVGCRLFKDRKGEISLSGYDLLNDHSSFSTSVFADYTESRWRTTSSGYWLATFIYKFVRNK